MSNLNSPVLSKYQPQVEVESCRHSPRETFEGALIKFARLYIDIVQQNISVI